MAVRARKGDSMDLKQMQYFLCLAQERNVTRAARRLNIVQPALSMQIAKLETVLGKQLFFRTAQGMSLTPAGEEFERLKALDHGQEPPGDSIKRTINDR